MNRARRHHSNGQALVFVALVLGLLVTLVVGVNEIALRRRTVARIQDSLDQAAAAAAVQLDTASLIMDAPKLLPDVAETRFRTMLRSGLTRVAAAITPDPATLAQRARMWVVPGGERCAGRMATSPAICVSLTVSLTGISTSPPITLTTLAQATHRP
jgi:hypothetical protein